MKNLTKNLVIMFTTDLAAYAAVTYKTEVKIHEQAAAACYAGRSRLCRQ